MRRARRSAASRPSQNFGAGDLLAIAPSVGDTLLVPFTKAFVPTLDFEGGRLVVAAGALLIRDDEANTALLGPENLEMWRATVLTLFPDMFPGPARPLARGRGLGAGAVGLRAL